MKELSANDLVATVETTGPEEEDTSDPSPPSPNTSVNKRADLVSPVASISFQIAIFVIQLVLLFTLPYIGVPWLLYSLYQIRKSYTRSISPYLIQSSWIDSSGNPALVSKVSLVGEFVSNLFAVTTERSSDYFEQTYQVRLLEGLFQWKMLSFVLSDHDREEPIIVVTGPASCAGVFNSAYSKQRGSVGSDFVNDKEITNKLYEMFREESEKQEFWEEVPAPFQSLLQTFYISQRESLQRNRLLLLEDNYVKGSIAALEELHSLEAINGTVRDDEKAP